MLKKKGASSGSLNLSGLELLREAENENSKTCYWVLIPSRKIMHNTQQRLHAVIDVIIPFKIKEIECGEAIQLDEQKRLKLLFKTYDTHEEAMNNSA